MASSTSVNPSFLGIRSHQVHLKDYYYEVNVRHILSDAINHISFLGFVPLSQSTIQRFMTLLPTDEAYPLKLLLLRDSPFKSQLIAFPIVIGFLELGTLMFHKVSLGLARIMCPFLRRSPIVFFDAKSNNHIFHAHLLSLMFEVIIKVFSSLRQLLNYSCNLKSFA